MKRKQRPTISKKKFNQSFKKNSNTKSRLANSFLHDSYSYYARKPVTTSKAPTRVSEQNGFINNSFFLLLIDCRNA